ncbi:MAG: PilZ domain-containing protein [Nitrospirae bacterium]|nr:PilZ domain-containing protein [Nitrospirota bacterium]
MDMNKRRAERLMMGFRAKLMQGGVNYTGVIEYISTTGIYLVTAPT